MSRLFEFPIKRATRPKVDYGIQYLHLIHLLFPLIRVALRHILDVALVDLHYLAVLYKLPRTDAGFLSIYSHRLPMSATLPAPPPPPSVGSDQHEDYEDHTPKEPQRRVFVDFDVFMKSVLRAPYDWKARWGLAIEAVKADHGFRKYHEEYLRRCEISGSQERTFHEPLMNTANAVLDVLSRSKFDNISSAIPQYYRVGDQKKLRGGVIDKVILHKDPKPSTEERGLHRANSPHVLEAKPYGSGLCDGTNMLRLAINGKCAISSPRA